MPVFPAQRLAQWSGGRWTSEPTTPLSGFCVDSRLVRPGQVFVALKTEKRDGHDFLASAEAAGAGAAIVAVPNGALRLPQLVVADPLVAFQAIAREHRRSFGGRVVGISGSAGKTSTKELLALLLGGERSGVPATEDTSSRSGDRFDGRVLATEGNLNKASASSGAPTASRVLATEGNLNNHLGVPLTLTRLDPARHDFAVIEAGISAPGEMRPLADMIEPDVALITVIAPAHTEQLGGLEGVAREKAVLPAATRSTGIAVFSQQTAAYAPFRELKVNALIVERTDALRPVDPQKNVVAYTLTHRGDESSLALLYGAPPPLVFTFRRVSDGMAQNAALAICAALWLGVPVERIAERLRAWHPASLRGEVRRENGRLLYLDCYNANPAAMADALTAFDAIAAGSEPRLYVIGSMEELGAESPAYHRALGRSLKLRADDRVFLIGSHADVMLTGALEIPGNAGRVQVAASAEALAPTVAGWRGAIFVKGSRRYQLEKALGSNGAGGAH